MKYRFYLNVIVTGVLLLGIINQYNTANAQSIKSRFKIALIQMNVVGGELQTNLGHAVKQIEAAANQGAQIALLPEAMDLGWTHTSA